jgi:hypothetical protein
MDDGSYDAGGSSGDDGRSGDKPDATAPAKRLAQAAQYRARAAAFSRAGFEAGTLGGRPAAPRRELRRPRLRPARQRAAFCGPNTEALTGELLCAAHDVTLHYDRECFRWYTLVYWRRGVWAHSAASAAAPTGAIAAGGGANAMAEGGAPVVGSAVLRQLESKRARASRCVRVHLHRRD